jgi:hypothetical protein
MPHLSIPSPRRRRASAVLATVLYLAMGVAAPLAHARGEVLSSKPEAEAQHTRLCARIHTEAACLVGITFQVLSPLPHALAPEPVQRSLPTGQAREPLLAHRRAPSPHPVRAPPAA